MTEQIFDKYISDLKEAFEAGEAFNAECNCGTCDYCIDVKTEDTPNFETWIKRKLNNYK